MKPSAEMPPTKAKLTVSREGFRQAFDLFTEKISNDQLRECVRAASQLLQKSPKFKAIVARLNSKYVSAVALGDFEPNEQGVLTTGRFSGRRTLAFSDLGEGSRFLQAGSHEIQGSKFPLSDWISIESTSIPRDSPEWRGKCIAEFVRSIAHETVHADRVSAAASGSSLPRKERVAASITEEINTRQEE